MNTLLRLTAITLFSAVATTAALKTYAFEGHGPGADHRPPMMAMAPLHDLREILPALKLSADQEALLQKAQGTFAQIGANQDYRRRKAMEEFRQGLAGNVPLGSLARKAADDRRKAMEQLQEAENQWFAFLDSLDATQVGQVRKHLLDRLEGMEKARARMAETPHHDAADGLRGGHGEGGRPQPR